MKKWLAGIGVCLILSTWAYAQDPTPMFGETQPEQVHIQRLALKAPEQTSFVQVQDTTHKNISLDSVEYSQYYKSPRLNTDRWIIGITPVADDSLDIYYLSQVCRSPHVDSPWVTIDSVAFDQDDSATTFTDTMLTTSIEAQYGYLRYAFGGTAANKQGTGVIVDYEITVVADPYTYWVGGTGEDTTGNIANPDMYSKWTLWFKFQHHDSSELRILSMLSYDDIHWTLDDSSKLSGDGDTLVHVDELSLSRAKNLKFRLDGDDGTPGANSDWDGNDSTAYMTGVMTKLWLILSR